MSSSARSAYLKLKTKIHFPSNPEIDRIQSELLSFSHSATCLTESPTSTSLLPTQAAFPIQAPPVLRGGRLPTQLSLRPNLSPNPSPKLRSQKSPLPALLHPSLPSSIPAVTILSLPASSDSTRPHQSPSSSFTPPMESALFNLLSTALPALLSKSSSSTSDDSQVPSIPGKSLLPLPGTHDSLVSAPPSAPPPTHSLRPPPTFKPSRSDLIRHFQWNCYDLTGSETGTTTIEIVTKPIIVNLSAPYQTARLTNLEVCLMPTHNAIKYPVTVEVIWAPASAAVPESKIMATYGSTRLVAGSLTNPSEHLTCPCDLTVNNPTVKSSVSFNDNPRLYIKFWVNEDSKKLGIHAPISASLFIRGSLELTAPATCATY